MRRKYPYPPLYQIKNKIVNFLKSRPASKRAKEKQILQLTFADMRCPSEARIWTEVFVKSRSRILAVS